MSQANVEIVRRDVAAQLADWAVLSAIWHPDIEIELVAGSGTFRGLEARRYSDGPAASRAPASVW
jgi:hypothetical protein